MNSASSPVERCRSVDQVLEVNQTKAMTYLRVEHLALSAQPVTLRHQGVNLLAPLQHALNCLMQHNFGLVQLLLNLHDAIRLLRILIFDNVVFQLRVRELVVGIRAGEGGAGMSGQELIDHFREQLMRHQGGVVVVGDDDAGDALGASVGVECVGWKGSQSPSPNNAEDEPTFFFNVLPLTRPRPLRHGLTEDAHEFAIAASGVSPT